MPVRENRNGVARSVAVRRIDIVRMRATVRTAATKAARRTRGTAAAARSQSEKLAARSIMSEQQEDDHD
jgi:hypothetical protein